MGRINKYRYKRHFGSAYRVSCWPKGRGAVATNG